MTYTIIYEKIEDSTFPSSYFYAHVPSLGLTTHGDGIEGAKKAVEELIRLWLEEKKCNGEEIKEEPETYFSKIVI